MRFLPILLILVLAAGCGSDPVQPGKDLADPEVWFEGSYDGSGFVLQRTEVFGPGGVLITLDLFASDLEFDAQLNRLAVVVHVRNSSRTDLYGPARVGIGDFNPPSVLPLNANSVSDPEGDAPRWWYDYSDVLGDDDILSAGEESGGVRWILQLPGPESFSFSAIARFAAETDRAVLGGHVFLDSNRNGAWDRGEPAGIGDLQITFPNGRSMRVYPLESGLWSVPAEFPGLYTVRWISPPTAGILPICLTTPNPLQVFMTPGPDGLPDSFRDADFGLDPEPCIPWRPMPIQVSEVPVDSLESDPWTLVELVQTGPDDPGPVRLEFTIGFGGCSAGHPLAFAFERPDDSTVPKTTMVATIVHDDLDEFCDAWFNVTRSVDLNYLRQQWLDLTGQEGPQVLELHTPQGIEIFDIR